MSKVITAYEPEVVTYWTENGISGGNYALVMQPVFQCEVCGERMTPRWDDRWPPVPVYANPLRQMQSAGIKESSSYMGGVHVCKDCFAEAGAALYDEVPYWLDEYAESVGVATGELTKAQKQQAFLLYVLQKYGGAESGEG